MSETIVKFSDPRDTEHFRYSETYILGPGGFRRETWRDRLKTRLRDWFKIGRRIQCVGIADGTITLAMVRWSWLRMKWVRL